jgi:phosphoribosylformimino-5-aminoimidazole carboxamide ribotide isomerase
MSHYFRPCIDLYQGEVCQIIGETLSDKKGPKINFTSKKPVEWYTELYKADKLENGHIILLGEGNEQTALRAVKGWRDVFHLGGGMDLKKADYWLKQGAKKIVFTSWIIGEQEIHWERLERLHKEFGRERIVLDISCKKFGEHYFIMTNRWRDKSKHNLEKVVQDFSQYAGEFLVHAAAVEGKKQGIDKELVDILNNWKLPLQITYAGGIASKEDIRYIVEKQNRQLYFTVGSALDIFGGNMPYQWVVKNFYQ